MVTQDLLDIADYLLEQIRDDCTGNKDHTYLILRVLSVFCMICIVSEAFSWTPPTFPSALDLPLFLFNAGHWKYWKNHGDSNPKTYVFDPEMYQKYRAIAADSEGCHPGTAENGT